MIKKYLLIIIFCLIQLSVFSQQIEFFNVGIHDTPPISLIISKDKKTDGEWIKNIVVSDEVYNILKQYVLNNNTHWKPVSYYKDNDLYTGIYNFGSYAVQVVGEEDSLLYFIAREKYTVYFKGLLKFLKQKDCLKMAEIIQSHMLESNLGINDSYQTKYLYLDFYRHSRLFYFFINIL
jgi:hypothetical protein